MDLLPGDPTLPQVFVAKQLQPALLQQQLKALASSLLSRLSAASEPPTSPPSSTAAGGRGLFVPLSPLSTAAHRQAASLSTGPFGFVDILVDVVVIDGVVSVLALLLTTFYQGFDVVLQIYFCCSCCF